MIHIDGSTGEGGGQVVRTSASLAAITGQPFEIVNVRAKRAKPGLQPQHLAAVRAGAELCDAELHGAKVGSTHLTFLPRRPVTAGDYRFDIGTAGSSTLVAQTVLMPLLLAQGESTVVVTGGTHNPMAPTSDYLERVYAPALRQMGASLTINCERAGFFPIGGGELRLQIEGGRRPWPLKRLERGEVSSVEAVIVISLLEQSIAERGKEALNHLLRREPRLHVRIDRTEAASPGVAVVILAECESGPVGFSAIGRRGKPMQAVTREACDQFLAWRNSEAAVDSHLADQLVLPASLATGPSEWTTNEVSEHLRTVVWVVGNFLDMEASVGEHTSVVPLH